MTAMRTSRRAVASLILSLCLGPVGAIPGIIFGHLARRDIRLNQNLKGSRLASFGLVIGYIFIGLTILYFVFYEVGGPESRSYIMGPNGKTPIGR